MEGSTKYSLEFELEGLKANKTLKQLVLRFDNGQKKVKYSVWKRKVISLYI
uniref:Uncharacterized protein n=1 Tax=Arion vulgaris TaxID=1028688 RepID=A0A0B6Z3F9_9EUPU